MSRKKCMSRFQSRNQWTLACLELVVRAALALAIAAVSAAQQPDGREIMRRSVRANDENWNRARSYTFLERVEEQQLNSAGQVKSRSVKT